MVANIARHVDSTLHLFEKWGLPIWKDAKGNYVHEGRWKFQPFMTSWRKPLTRRRSRCVRDRSPARMAAAPLQVWSFSRISRDCASFSGGVAIGGSSG